MLLYALGTAACAFAPNIWMLVVFRIVASLGIGGEWAAGAAMVAEVVPERRRVEAGALLYTSAPVGLFLATFVNFQIAGVLFKGAPETSWRYVFLCGLVPAAVAFVVRLFVNEPERWRGGRRQRAPPRCASCSRPSIRALTLGGFAMALMALITWWSCNAFIPHRRDRPGAGGGRARASTAAATLALVETLEGARDQRFNLGGLIGTLLTIPAAKLLGRRKMFAIYFALSAVGGAGDVRSRPAAADAPLHVLLRSA